MIGRTICLSGVSPLKASLSSGHFSSCRVGHPSTSTSRRKERTNIKLYVRRVFIMDDYNELMTEWLNL